MEINNTRLTNEQLNEIVDTIKDNTSEQVERLRAISEEVQNTDNSENQLEAERVDICLDNPTEYVAQHGDAYNRSNVSLFDLDKENLEAISDKEVEDSVTDTAKELFDLDDESVLNLLSIVREYKKDNNYPVWQNMNEKLRDMVKLMSLNVPEQFGGKNADYATIAKSLIQTFIDEAEMDQAFIDLEQTLNEALNIPSIIDLYTEHTNKLMEEKIPEMVKELREADENEKADKLEMVMKSLTDAYDLHLLVEAYNNSSRIRKAVRRDWIRSERFEDDLNHSNKKTKFMMNDAHQLILGLKQIGEYSEEEYKKFIVLLAMSLEELDRDDLPQAAYIYYLIKNVTILRYKNEHATEFSTELINNIKKVIRMICEKEAEFNNEHVRVQHKPKRSVRKREHKQRVQAVSKYNDK